MNVCQKIVIRDRGIAQYFLLASVALLAVSAASVPFPRPRIALGIQLLGNVVLAG